MDQGGEQLGKREAAGEVGGYRGIKRPRRYAKAGKQEDIADGKKGR